MEKNQSANKQTKQRGYCSIYNSFYNKNGELELREEQKLFKLNSFESLDELKFDSPEKIQELFCKKPFFLNKRTEESFFVVGFNAKNVPLGVFEISRGTLNASLVAPREIFKKVILLNALSIALIHNHPSGDLTPSKEDFAVTKKIKKGCDILDIKLLDHIIIPGDGFLGSYSKSYYSFRERRDI